MKEFYAVCWESKSHSHLVFEHKKADEHGRKFWLGGGGKLIGLVFISSQSAHSKKRQVVKDFTENHSKGSLVQSGKVVVKKIMMFPL